MTQDEVQTSATKHAYRSGETPRIGDRVVFTPENPLHLFRRSSGSLGTVYALGADLVYPAHGTVYVDWDTKRHYDDDDTWVKLLTKVSGSA